MTERRPRAVLFDLFHTLVNVAPEPGTGRTTWAQLGVDRDAWERTLFEDAPGRAVGRVRCPVEGMRLLARKIDPSIPESVIARVARWRVTRFDHTLRNPEPEVVEAVARIRRAGVRTALVSNAGFDEIGAWADSPLAPHFDTAIFSCDVGVAKPDAAIYRHALDRLGLGAEGALFVGDGGSDEHRGARAVGLRPVLVTRWLAEAWPDRVAARAQHVDEVHHDVAAVADRVLGSAPA